jgi:hypothetical protein
MTHHRVVDLVANSKLVLHWLSKQVGKVGGMLDAAYAESLAREMTDLQGFVASAERDWRSVDANAFHAAKERIERTSVRLHEVSIAESLRGSDTQSGPTAR